MIDNGVDESAFTLRQTPGIRIAISLIQRIQALVSLLANETHFVRKLKEVRGDIDKPFWTDSRNFPHVLLGSEDQFVVKHPLRFLIEKRRRGVDIDLMVIDKGTVASL